jgi:hypothetical protein
MGSNLEISPGETSYISGGLDGSIVNSGGTRNISGGPTGVADFNRDTSLHIVCPSTLTQTDLNNVDFNFKLWMDVSYYSTFSAIIFNTPGSQPSNGKFVVYLKDNTLIVDCGSIDSPQIKAVDISALSQQIVDVKIKTTPTSGGRDIDYIMINDVSRNLLPVSSTVGVFDVFKIGLLGNPAFPQFQYPLYNATIWDIDIPGRHHWTGYPSGNTNDAWVDQIAVDTSAIGNLTLSPSDTPNIIEISGGYIPPKPPKNAPELYRPLDNSIIDGLDTSLAWLSVSDASSYWLWVDDSTGFASLVYDVSGLLNLYYDVSSLNAGTDYYWKVAGVNQYGVGPWSEVRKFSTASMNIPFIAYGGISGDAGYTLDIGDNWIDVSFGPYISDYILLGGQAYGQNRNSIMWRDLQHIILQGRIQSDNDTLLKYSSDAGQNWSSTIRLTNKKSAYYCNWVPDDGSVRTMGWGQSSISRDYGATWNDVSLLATPVSFSVSDSGQYLYAGSAADSKIYQSDNYGESFTVGIDVAGVHMYVTCDESGQYAGGGYGAYSNQVAFTDDYGSSWSILGAQGRIHINPDATRIIFYNESSTGVFYVSTNYGSSWSAVASPFDSSALYATVFMETLDGSIYLHQSNQRKFCRLNPNADGFEVFTMDNSIWGFAISAFGRGVVYGTEPTYTPYKIFYSDDYEDFSSWTEIYSSNTKHPRYLTCQ